MQFKLCMGLAFVVLCFASCKTNGEINEKSLVEQSIRSKVVDSMNAIRKFDSLTFENKKIVALDSLLAILNKKEATLSELYDSLKQSVVSVTVANDDEISYGSAFFIKSTGYLLTNYHVIENTNRGFIETSNGHKYDILEIISKDEQNDWAVFKIENLGDTFPTLKLTEKKINIGEKCFAIGSPMQLKLSISEGLISGFRSNNAFIQTTTQITHGSSGGPLFTVHGELIGITTAGMANGDLNFAINLQNLKSTIPLLQ